MRLERVDRVEGQPLIHETPPRLVEGRLRRQDQLGDR